MLEPVWTEVSAYSSLELIASMASLIYVVLAARGNRYCWPAAFLGSAIFVLVFWQHKLFMDSGLNVYYAVMAVYGWAVWNRSADSAANPSSRPATPISSWTTINHIYAIAGITILTLLSGNWLALNSQAAFPYLDSLTTWASLLATWMVARKILQNWLYWILIDLLSLYLYINKGLFFTTALFVIYVVIAVYGYYHWRTTMQKEQQSMTNKLRF